MGNTREIWVFVEQEEGEIAPVSLELLAKARDLAGELEGRVCALLLGQGIANLAQQVIHYGADKVFLAEHAQLAVYRTLPYAEVVINLVMNALSSMDNATAPPGRLIFRTYRDELRKKAFLEIEDSGCGIPNEHLPQIFDPFFTTKPPGKGTGLGLSTVYGLIRENNGHIEVKQTSAQGTTFRVEIPLFQPPEHVTAGSKE